VTGPWVSRAALLVVIGAALTGVAIAISDAAPTSMDFSTGRVIWTGVAGGVLARLVGRGWRDWLVFTAAILATAAASTFVEVYAASLLHRVLGSLFVFGVLAIPASLGWSLSAVVTRVLTTPGGLFVWLLGAVVLAIPWSIGRRRVRRE